MDEFTVAATTSPTTSQVTVTGDVDLASASRLRTTLVPLARPGAELAVDCAGVRFLDSAGLRVLLELNRRARDTGGTLVLVAPSDVVTRVLDLSGVTGLFTVRPAAAR